VNVQTLAVLPSFLATTHGLLGVLGVVPVAVAASRPRGTTSTPRTDAPPSAIA
jgi:hypothetical protein